MPKKRSKETSGLSNQISAVFLKTRARQSLITILFIIIPALVILIAFFKIVSSKPEYVYAKVKVSQGLWWASTKRPNYWLIESLRVGEQERGLTGSPTVELLGFTYYPHVSRLLDTSIVNPETTYNIYLDLKIKAEKTRRGEFVFKRNTVAVGSPIEISFPSTQITGTVIRLSEQPIEDDYLIKTLYLSGNAAYAWEHDAIKVGDKYLDGKQEVFRVLEKQSASLNEGLTTVKARVKLKKGSEGKLFFGEEQEILIGAPFELITQNANYSFLSVRRLE